MLTELPFPDGSGMDLVRLITAHLPSTRTVVHTWFADIPTAVAAAKAGPLDALVNNAGVGMLNVLEGSEMSKARELFETNVLGTIAMSRAVLPQMRVRSAGVIVNVSSSVTIKPLPALSIYSASKAALNAFSESLVLEASLFGVRVRIVLPGAAPTTDFGKNAVARMGMEIPGPYDTFVADYLGKLRSGSEFSTAEDVAQAVLRAVAAAGHSFGGHTVGLLLGARVAGEDFSDPRITAGILLATPGRGGRDLTQENAARLPFFDVDFSTLTARSLVVCGEADDPHFTTRGPEWHADAFHDAPGADTLLTLRGVGHGLGGIAGLDAKETEMEAPEVLEATKRLTLAWLRTALAIDGHAWVGATGALKDSASSLATFVEKYS